MFSARPKAAGETGSEGVDPVEFQTYFMRKGRYTAGTETRYGPSILTAAPVHQHLAEGFGIGMRFHSAPAIRLADAKAVHLGHAVKADGRWRLFVFADGQNPADASSPVRTLCDFLADSGDSPVKRHTPPSADIDSVIDVRAVLQQGHRELDLDKAPALLLPRKGRYRLIDYEKMYCADIRPGMDVFTLRGVDRERGCVVVVRPDQYVASILPLDDHAGLVGFFDRFLLRQN